MALMVTLVVVVGIIGVSSQTFAATKSFSMTAQQWDFAPSTITVSEGDTVNLSIKSIDVDHGFAISEFGVNTTLKAGTTTNVSFVADTAGTYTFFCSVFCGSGHGSMTGTLVVQSAGSDDTTDGTDGSSDTTDEDTTTTDSTAPTISGIAVTAEVGTATVSWTTNESAVGQVEYGTDSGAYIAATPMSGTFSTSHSATLTGLSSGTEYFFRIKAQDNSENQSRSSESSFTTDGSDEDEDADEESETEDSDDATDEEEEGTNEEDADEETEDGADAQEENSSLSILSIETDVSTYTPSSYTIQLTQGEQMSVRGTADPSAEIVLEFCCATTRYTAIADSTGAWSFQGVLSLDTGDNYVKVYQKDAASAFETINFEVVDSEQGDDADTEEADDAEETVDSTGMGVTVIIIIGLLIVLFSGVMFVRQLRR